MEAATAVEEKQSDTGERNREDVCIAYDILKCNLADDSSYNMMFIKHRPYHCHVGPTRASGFGNSGHVIHVGKYVASTLGINDVGM